MARAPGSAVLLAAAGVACSPGPGRPPLFADASVRPDAAPAEAAVFPDAAPPRDAGLPDGAVVLKDGGEPPETVFSGVFGILNDANVLYARELRGRLSLLVGQVPYVYLGTISPAGDVDLVSDPLVRSGCQGARISGRYDRRGYFYTLRYRACNAQLQPVESEIQGGFMDDYFAGWSGIYDLDATIMQDAGGCFQGMMGAGPYKVRYGINFVASQRRVTVFTADDLISAPALYVGLFDPNDSSFSAIQQIFAAPDASDVSMRGQIEQISVRDPPRFLGRRDVFDPMRRCGFGIVLDGRRVNAP